MLIVDPAVVIHSQTGWRETADVSGVNWRLGVIGGVG